MSVASRQKASRTQYIMERCATISDLKPARLEVLAKYVAQCRDLPGEMVEVGVWRGGSARLICELAPEKTVHLFDTFCGLPAPSHPGDRHRKGDWSDTGVDVVKDTLAGLDNYELHVGEFPASLPTEFVTELSFVHLDTDLYAPTAAALDLLWPRVATNGVMLFDDYAAGLCAGVMVAVHEWLEHHRDEVTFAQHGIAAAVTKL